jgi:DedD protein
MRDADRLREKIQLSLDDRQVAVLAVCALLLLGGVFALGLLVGKRLAAAAPQAARLNDLAALDEEQPLPAERPRTPPAQVAAKPPAPVAAKPQVAAEKAAAEDLDRDPDEQPVAEQGKPPEEAPAPTPTPAPAPAHPAAKPAPSARQAQTALVPTEPVLIDPPPKPRTVEPAPSAIVLSVPPRNLGPFTVQLGASQDRADAQRLESRARGAGLKPYVVEARLGNKGTWYRVRVGSFNDKDAANNFRQDVERELRLSAMVMPTR